MTDGIPPLGGFDQDPRGSRRPDNLEPTDRETEIPAATRRWHIAKRSWVRHLRFPASHRRQATIARWRTQVYRSVLRAMKTLSSIDAVRRA